MLLNGICFVVIFGSYLKIRMSAVEVESQWIAGHLFSRFLTRQYINREAATEQKGASMRH